ncbi:MAG: RHS repeat-associated core domain-containing protein [Candidatus Hydrogenedentes bacterium]|nr:RHS repeat-associated core domain-containing protein [Candidatus Hydrogenedentota bacterium]
MTTQYNWDAGLNLISEQTTGGTLSKTFVHNPLLNWHSLLADVSGTNPGTGTAQYYTLDLHGSTRGLWDASKNALGAYEYTPYGESYANTGPSVLHGFTGQLFDPLTGMNSFGAREYNPAFGRWASREPSGLDGPNLYHYGFGNPVGYVDHGGEFALPVLAAAVAAVAAAAVVAGAGAWWNATHPLQTPSIELPDFASPLELAYTSTIAWMMAKDKNRNAGGKKNDLNDNIRDRMNRNPRGEGESIKDYVNRLFGEKGSRRGPGSDHNRTKKYLEACEK